MTTRLSRYRHEFTEFIPDHLAPGVLYVSLEYATCAHLCACGCGIEVVTRLSPADYTVSFDGETVSLDHSIGNWSYACQSHYFLRGGMVRWSGRWTAEQIARGRTRTAQERTERASERDMPTAPVATPRRRWWRRS